MDQKIKQKWINALRSGEYSKVTGVLRDDSPCGGFCALGVLVDVLVQEEEFDGKVFWEDSGSLSYFSYMGEHPVSGELERLEGDGDLGYLGTQIGIELDEEARIIAMNDGLKNKYGGYSARPMSFEQIANWIEKNL